MKVRRGRGRVAGRADIAEDVAATEGQPLADAGRVTVEMRVVVAALAGQVVFIERDPARAADEELAHGAVNRGEDRRAARRQDVDGVVQVPGAAFVEGALELGCVHALHGDERAATSGQRIGGDLIAPARCPLFAAR